MMKCEICGDHSNAISIRLADICPAVLCARHYRAYEAYKVKNKTYIEMIEWLIKVNAEKYAGNGGLAVKYMRILLEKHIEFFEITQEWIANQRTLVENMIQ